jgi:hypothetical protein
MRYQFCLKAVMLSLLFSSGLPTILFVAALSLLLVYWIDKHNGALPVNRLLHAMPCHALPCHALPCHAMPCHALPCHALPCLAMPCLAMPCHAMPWCALCCIVRAFFHIGCRTSHAWSMS